jgi:hypothetical protein
MRNFVLLYKDQAKQAKQAIINGTAPKRALTPGAAYRMNSQTRATAVLTPNGQKPVIKAFCPMTPLLENYPSKHLSMKTIF